jgi:hypothetical protein
VRAEKKAGDVTQDACGEGDALGMLVALDECRQVCGCGCDCVSIFVCCYACAGTGFELCFL